MLPYFAAFVVTALLLYVLRHAAPTIGLLDQAKGHKIHARPTPVVGGIGIFLGFFFSILLVEIPLSGMRPFFAACGMLVVIGVLDDVHELSSNSRFMAQIIAAVILVYWGGIQLDSLGYLVSEKEFFLGYASVGLTIFSTVGVINAFNMIDGIDGLSGSVFLVAFGSLLWLCLDSGFDANCVVILLVSLGVAAFLMFNVQLGLRKQAAMFLGDAGSMFLGFVLAWFLIDLSQGEDRVMEPITALWLIALPLTDTVVVMFRRIFHGNSPIKADRTHIHHLMLHAGFTVNQTLVILTAVAAFLAGVGLVAHYLEFPARFMFLGFLVLFSLMFLISTFYVKRHQLYK